jgi:hypothetical protein
VECLLKPGHLVVFLGWAQRWDRCRYSGRWWGRGEKADGKLEGCKEEIRDEGESEEEEE